MYEEIKKRKKKDDHMQISFHAHEFVLKLMFEFIHWIHVALAYTPTRARHVGGEKGLIEIYTLRATRGSFVSVLNIWHKTGTFCYWKVTVGLLPDLNLS